MSDELPDSINTSRITHHASLRNIALELEYDGTELLGSQYQAHGRTVQGELEAAWNRLTKEAIRWTFAGRTDAGVHARGQVANARTQSQLDVATVQRALNALLPRDIGARRAWDVPAEFHARFSAVRRAYRYVLMPDAWRSPLWRRHALQVDRALDVAAMDQAARMLVGVHDFAAFGSLAPGSTVRECFAATCADVEALGYSLIAIDIAANGFLRHMVRTVVGTLLAVGQGRLPPEDVGSILQSRDRSRAGPTAPPHGLYLMSVTYPQKLGERPADTFSSLGDHHG